MSTWPLVPLKYVARINPETLTDRTPLDYRFQYIDISQVDSAGRISFAADDVAFAQAPSRARRIVKPEDVIISTVRTYLRAIARVPDNADQMVVSTGFAVARANHRADSRFLGWACQSGPFIDQVVARSTGISYPAINPSDLAAIPIPLPPLEEQRRIANYLDDQTTRIDQTIQLRQQQMNLTEARLQAKVQEAVTGTAVPGERTGNALPWVDSIPAGWGTPRISQVARMGTGHTPSRSESAYWVDCKIPWLTTSDVHRFRHDEIDFIETTTVQISQLGVENSAAVVHPAGTVALSRTASAGFSIIMATDMATSQDFVTWTCGSQVNPEFLLWCLRAMRADMLGRLATGSTHKTIYFPDLMAIRMPLAPMEYQSHAVAGIRAAADATRTARTSLNLAIQLLQERKRALITATVTGELDVSSASSRAADAVVSGVGVGL